MDNTIRIERRQSKYGMVVRSYWCTEEELSKTKIGAFTSVYRRKGKRILKDKLLSTN